VNLQQQNDKIDELMDLLPWYVDDFISKLKDGASGYSNYTKISYLEEIRRFFEWLVETGLTIEYTADEHNITHFDITLQTLEQLDHDDITDYLNYIKAKPNRNDENAMVANSTTNHAISSLSSLFKFLTTETEVTRRKKREHPELIDKEIGDLYFSRNVMNMFHVGKNKETLQHRADELRPKLFLDDETNNYLDFIDSTYETKLNKRQLSFFLRDKERDLAINALILASGIRVSELVNIDMNDLNMKTATVNVTRKGGKRDAVYIAPFGMPYLEQYLEIRRKRYNADGATKPFFLTKKNGEPARIAVRTVQDMVGKYSQEFKVKVSPHKLRHTLATRLYKETHNTRLVQTQLGHSTEAATKLYTHVVSEEQKNALDKL
jgi:site-specific recombinase XerD